MKATFSIFFSVCILLLKAQTSTHNLTDKSKRIDSFMTAIYSGGQFMGAALVAEQGKIGIEFHK